MTRSSGIMLVISILCLYIDAGTIRAQGYGGERIRRREPAFRRAHGVPRRNLCHFRRKPH